MPDLSNSLRPEKVGKRPLARKIVGLLLSLALTLGLLFIAEWLIGWGQLLATWQMVPWSQLVWPCFLVLVSYGLRGLRLRGWFGPLAWRPLVQLVLLHNFWNNILPMRAGEVSFPLLLRRNFDIQLAPATVALLWFRVLDLACLLLIFGLAWAWIFMPVLLPLPPLLLALLAYSLSRLLPRISQSNLIQRHAFLSQLAVHLQSSPFSHSAALSQSSPHLQSPALLQSPAGANSGRLARTLIWTLLNWLVKLLAYGLVISLFLQHGAKSSNLPQGADGSYLPQGADGAAGVTLLEGVLGAIGGEVTSVLPIHGFAGAGSYEAGVLLFLQLTSLGLEEALAAGISLHLFFLSITMITGAFAPLLSGKSDLSRNQ